MEQFYNLAPEDYPKVDLKSMTQAELRELAYFTWCMYQDDEDVLSWREEKVLPLLAADEEDFDSGE